MVTPFLRKPIVMCPLIFQKIIIIMTFFTDSCTRKFFFTVVSVYLPTVWTVFFLTEACSGKPMFSSFVNIFLTTTCFSVYLTQSFINFSWFTLLTLTKDLITAFGRCPWCNGYRRRKSTWRHELKSWPRLIAFHIALIPLGKVWIQLFSLQLWVNSRAD